MLLRTDAPLRVIKDPYPTYSAVAVDFNNGEIVLQDENLFQIMVYDRTANTPPQAAMTRAQARDRRAPHQDGVQLRLCTSTPKTATSTR